jgi:REP element-mobilizing transposase RayT
MSRQLRLEYPGALWHLTSRGNERRDIFRDDIDRRFFLELLGEAVERFDWILPAYVLMSNHFHLLLRLTARTLSRGMKWLNSQYAGAFNRRHRRVGHLFQGRFHGVLVDEQAYFLEVARYIVLNPVRACIVRRPEQYEWSSHLALLGEAPLPDWLAAADVLVQFATPIDLARQRYRAFVNEAIGSNQRPWDDVVGQIYLGRKEWIDEVREQIALRPRSDDHPRLQREFREVAMADVVGAVARTWAIDPEIVRRGRGGVHRMAAAWIGCHEALLTQREIAAGLRLRSESRVSRLVRFCDRQLGEDEGLRNRIDESISTLRGKKAQVQMRPR